MGTEPNEHRGLSRRHLLALPAALAALTACSDPAPPAPAAPARVTAPPADGVLAANYNQNLDLLRFDELQDVNATWVRGFHRLADDGDPTPAIRDLLTAATAGYGTVLSLKFLYPQGLPRAGTPAMDTVLRRLDKILAAAMGKVSIIVVGNEPFYECSKEDRGSNALNAFYERLARHVLDQRDPGHRTEIYLGALTGIDDPARRTPQVERWLEFLRNTPELAGTDCHPHVPSLAAGQEFVDYLLPRLGPGQKFLATEFSLVKLYREHLKDPVPTGYADRRRVPRGTPVWQVLRGFLENPVPQEQWTDFLSACPWFAGNAGFVTDLMARFRRTGRCALAAYGITQDEAMSTAFGPDSTPWILNSVFCPRTVRPGQDGLPGRNTTWADEFRAAQQR